METSVTSKGKRWEILHSLWIGWTLTLGLLNWVAFLYVGYRAWQRKWIIWGLIYLVPLVVIVNTRPQDLPGWLPPLVGILWLGLWVVSIFHAFKIRKEYLLRLELSQAKASEKEAELRRRLHVELNGGGITAVALSTVAPEEVETPERDASTLQGTDRSTAPTDTATSPASSRGRSSTPPESVGRTASRLDLEKPAPPSDRTTDPSLPDAASTPAFVVADKASRYEADIHSGVGGPIPARYPIPLTYSYRLIEAEFESLRILKETYRNAEGLTAFLASMALALVHDPSSSTKKYLRNAWGGKGATFGDWFSILTKATRVIDEERGPLYRSTKGLLGTEKELSSFAENIRWLMDRRNELHHSDLPVGSKTERLIQEAHSRMDRCISETASIWQHPLRLVLDYDAPRDSSEYVLATCLDYSGDHPVGRKVQEKYRGIPKKQDLYVLQNEQEWIPLYPFISIHYCDHCHARETYFVDSWAGSGGEAGLRSFERAHEETSQEIGQALTRWLA